MNIEIAILKAEELEANLCSNCFRIKVLREGEYSNCCGAIIVTPHQLVEVLAGKIPRIRLGSARSKVVDSGRPRARRDAESGIRIGTNKYKVYKIWKGGTYGTPVDIAKMLNLNESSVRSWCSQFNRRYSKGGTGCKLLR